LRRDADDLLQRPIGAGERGDGELHVRQFFAFVL
jgi:hypothetical protein